MSDGFSDSDTVLCANGRLSQSPEEMLVTSAFRSELQAQVCLSEEMNWADMAHVIALVEARDLLGSYLADAWEMLDADMLSYFGVERALLVVDQEITGGAFRRIIEGNFRMREIGLTRPGPRLSKPDGTSHVSSVRTLKPE